MEKIYPLHKNMNTHLWITVALSVWVYLFLFFSEPFDINRFTKEEKLFLLPFYGIIAGLSYLFPLYYQKKVLGNENSWKIKNELLFLVIAIFLGWVFNYIFYKILVAENEPGTYNIFHYLRWIYAPALLIILPFIIITRYIFAKLFEQKIIERKITIKGKGQHDFIQLKFDNLLFIQSSDNYIDIHYLEETSIHKKVIRGTITEIANNFPELLKIHRSFLINPSHFKQFKTENKKWYIDIGFGFLLPISRGLQTSVKEFFQFTTNK